LVPETDCIASDGAPDVARAACDEKFHVILQRLPAMSRGRKTRPISLVALKFKRD
jgi:hypothetical protein